MMVRICIAIRKNLFDLLSIRIDVGTKISRNSLGSKLFLFAGNTDVFFGKCQGFLVNFLPSIHRYLCCAVFWEMGVGGFRKWGYPNRLFTMENPTRMEGAWGQPYDLGHHHILKTFPRYAFLYIIATGFTRLEPSSIQDSSLRMNTSKDGSGFCKAKLLGFLNSLP